MENKLKETGYNVCADVTGTDLQKIYKSYMIKHSAN